jgi:hypothetical protein
MINMIYIFRKSVVLGLLSLAFFGCQEMDRPELGDYPLDENPPGGPLKFYVHFDGTSTDPLMIAVDNIKATFPTDNPFTTVEGITGKATEGVQDKFIAYAKPNDFASIAKSFTISLWEKHDGQTKNGANPGAEEIFSLPSSNGHWSSGAMFLLFDAAPTPTAAAVKFVLVDANMVDTFLTWEGANSVEGLLDNQWHHCAFVYDAATSGLTFYKDGVVVSTVTWNTGAGPHGDVNLDDSKVTGLRIGNGPQPQNGTGDNWLASNWKGGIDQFRMYATALTAEEVMSLYTNKE